MTLTTTTNPRNNNIITPLKRNMGMIYLIDNNGSIIKIRGKRKELKKLNLTVGAPIEWFNN